jgi:ubiquinone/menaquinone biosynthesis C-methylase UbiE/16S rRNA G966 N2-methylase RsmD
MEKLIKKHFPEIKVAKQLVDSGNQTEIIKAISKIKKTHKKDYYTKSQTYKAKMYVSQLPKREYQKYLDIGAASGHLTKEIGELVGSKEIVGIDIENWAEQEVQKKLDIVKIYDGHKIPYPDEYFDLVSMIFTIHHIPNYQEIINEAIRVTKKDGIILVVEHNAKTQEEKDIIEFDHLLYMIEKADNYKEYENILKNYYSIYFSLHQLKMLFGLPLIKVYFYPDDILRRYIGIYKKVDVNKEKITKILNKRFDNLRITPESLYSVSHYDDIDQIIKKFKPETPEIIDANANIGFSSYLLSKWYKKVIALEIEPYTCDVAKHNLDIFGIKNIEFHCVDALDYLKDVKNTTVMLDPPWGGKDYKFKKEVDLFLGAINIKKLIKDLVKNKNIILLKAPLNYNEKDFDFSDKLKVMRQGKPSYAVYLIR